MTKLAALYARVSTLQQEQEATIDSQVAAIETYAQGQGYQLTKDLRFLDRAVSGSSLDRPAMNRLRDLVGEGLFEVILCMSPDRLARKYAHQWVLMNEFQRAGIKVIFVNQPAVEDNPQGELFLGIQGLFAEFERAMITERFRRGKLYRIRQGELVNPVPPYGYRYIPKGEPNGGHWEINPIEAKTVELIYQWYTEKTHPSTHQLVQRLNQLGERAPARGQQWRTSTLLAILKQVDYTGKAYYNRTRTCNEAIGRPRQRGRGRKQDAVHLPRPKEEWIPMPVPAIISEDLWQQAQERLAMKHKFATRNNSKNFYLLRSLLVCSICGHTLIGRTTSYGRTYYCPSQGKRRSPDVSPHSRVIAAETIETAVWQATTHLLQNPTLIADAWQNQNASEQAKPDEAERLQERLKTLERQWQRLLDLFQEEQIEKAELSRRKEQLDREKETIVQRLQQLQKLARQELAKEQMLQDFAAFCRQIEAGLERPTPEVQQEVIRLLIDHVVVGDGEIVIKHIVPTDDDCRLLPGCRRARRDADKTGEDYGRNYSLISRPISVKNPRKSAPVSILITGSVSRSPAARRKRQPACGLRDAVSAKCC
jgi:site-specific DNA recombinase